jgi:hypothetical protein
MNGIPILQLFNKGNPLRSIVILFIFFQALWTFIGVKKSVECSPFYLYGMYSDILKTNKSQSSIVLYINDSILDIRALPYWEKEYVMNTVNYFAALADSNGKNPLELIVKSGALLPPAASGYFYNCLLNSKADLNAFPSWLKAYMDTILQKKINKFEVRMAVFRYEKTMPEKLSEKTVFEL